MTSITASASQTARRWLRLALSPETPRTRRELLVTGLLLTGLGICVYGPHVLHGGLYADDWSLAALYRFPSAGGHVSDFQGIASARPVQAMYLLLTFAVLGSSAPAQLTVALLLGLVASLLFYVVLRTLSVPRLHAVLIAALALLFPGSDATKLWADASAGQLSVSFYCVGLLLTLRAFRRPGPRGLVTHIASAALYALSIMTYETTAPLIAVSALLFTPWPPRRAVLYRTLADIALVAVILEFVTSRTAKVIETGLGPMLTHARIIADQGTLVYSQSLFPFYSVPERRLTLGLAIAACACGCVVLRMLPRDSHDREVLRRSLGLLATGLCVTAAGWAMLLPASEAYSPAGGGDSTRLNVVAGFGIVLSIFGLTLTCGVLAFRGLARSRTLGSLAGCAGALLIAAGYTYRVADDIDRWDAAAAIRSQVLATVRESLPHLPRGAYLYVTGFVEEPYANIGSFVFPWDLRGAVQVTYDDPSLIAQPVTAPASLRCGARVLSALAGASDTATVTVPYGTPVYLVSYDPRYVRVVTTRRDCLAVGGIAAPI